MLAHQAGRGRRADGETSVVTLVEGITQRALREIAVTAPGRACAPMNLLTDIDAVVFVDGTLLHANISGQQVRIRSRAQPDRRARARDGRLAVLHQRHRPPAGAVRDGHRALGFEIADGSSESGGRRRALDRAPAPSKSVLVLGGPGSRASASVSETIETAEPAVADIVLVGWDDTLTYAALRATPATIWAGAPLLATSTRRILRQRRRGSWLVGAVAAGIRQARRAR
jgi:hypothetical protein